MSQHYQRVPPWGAQAYGSDGQVDKMEALEPSKSEEDKSPLGQFFSLRFYQLLAVEAFAGITTAVATYYVMNWIREREDRKREEDRKR